MSYRIIIDSCGEQLAEWKNDKRFERAALTLEVDGKMIVDDETFDQAEFLRLVAASPECPRSSCPSPERYLDSFRRGGDSVYAVTLSEQLSGSYNSAMLGRNLYIDEGGKANVYVFNSRSASVGETLIAMKIVECEEAGFSFKETVYTVENYINDQQTLFVLENLETFRKNGRLSNLKAFVAQALNIKPLMGSTPEGTIRQITQARGMKKALMALVGYIDTEIPNKDKKILGIAHCNCLARAEHLRDVIASRMNFKDIIIVDTAGVSSMYANDGGIIVVA